MVVPEHFALFRDHFSAGGRRRTLSGRIVSKGAFTRILLHRTGILGTSLDVSFGAAFESTFFGSTFATSRRGACTARTCVLCSVPVVSVSFDLAILNVGVIVVVVRNFNRLLYVRGR